jgi:phosphoribosylanthranilate isomerase
VIPRIEVCCIASVDEAWLAIRHGASALGLVSAMPSGPAVPVFLAGGLRAGIVAEAVGRVRPFGVDVCTGVRTGGALAETKLRRFAAAIRGG